MPFGGLVIGHVTCHTCAHTLPDSSKATEQRHAGLHPHKRLGITMQKTDHRDRERVQPDGRSACFYPAELPPNAMKPRLLNESSTRNAAHGTCSHSLGRQPGYQGKWDVGSRVAELRIAIELARSRSGDPRAARRPRRDRLRRIRTTRFLAPEACSRNCRIWVARCWSSP